MIDAEMSAFLRMLKDSKHASSNSKEHPWPKYL
jgi:hypothetical protein